MKRSDKSLVSHVQCSCRWKFFLPSKPRHEQDALDGESNTATATFNRSNNGWHANATACTQVSCTSVFLVCFRHVMKSHFSANISNCKRSNDIEPFRQHNFRFVRLSCLLFLVGRRVTAAESVKNGLHLHGDKSVQHGNEKWRKTSDRCRFWASRASDRSIRHNMQ